MLTRKHDGYIIPNLVCLTSTSQVGSVQGVILSLGSYDTSGVPLWSGSDELLQRGREPLGAARHDAVQHARVLRDVDVDQTHRQQRRVVRLVASRDRRVQRLALRNLHRHYRPETHTRRNADVI